jgi:hypothetical protein
VGLRGLHRRLERLEAARAAEGSGRQAQQEEHEERLRRRLMTRFFHEIGQARRRLAGLVPESDLPYTEEDRENDRRFLEEISAYRERRGWQTEEARAVLNYWQRNTEERLKGD